MALLYTAAFMFLCLSSVQAKVSFEGTRAFTVPFYPSMAGFVKSSFIASSTTRVTLKCETSFDGGPVSIFKGPWSNPAILVDRNNALTSDVSFFVNGTYVTYQIGTPEVTQEDSGTFFCFRTERVSDLEIIDHVSFSELLVQNSFTLFCMMHSYTDSIFLSNFTSPLVHCITFSEDLRNTRENIGLYLWSKTGEKRERIDDTASIPFSRLEIPSVPPLGELIYEILVDDPGASNMSMVTCERGDSSNLCTNIQPLLLYSRLEVAVYPQNVTFDENSSSLEFLCVTIPNIAGKAVWRLSEESVVPYASPTVHRTAAGSKLILNDIKSTNIEDKNFEVTCAVSFGDAAEVKASSVVVISEGMQNSSANSSIMYTWCLNILAYILIRFVL